MSKLSLELQTDLKNKAINLCCDITKLFDEFNSKKRKTDKSWRNLNVNTSVHDKFHRALVLSGFFFLKIASTFLNSSFFPKPIKRRIAI